MLLDIYVLEKIYTNLSIPKHLLKHLKPPIFFPYPKSQLPLIFHNLTILLL